MTAVRRFLAGGWLPAYAFLYVVFLYLPVIFLPIFSINTAATPKFPLTGFTLHWYEDLPRTPALLDAARNSLIVGVSTAILSTVLGILSARSITRYRYPGRRAINGLIMAPLVLPEVIVAISMLLVMLQLGLSLSLFTVVLGHVLVCIPYSMTVLTSGFEGFDRSLMLVACSSAAPCNRGAADVAGHRAAPGQPGALPAGTRAQMLLPEA